MQIEAIIPLILSIVAIGVSLLTFFLTYRRSRKTEELKLCLDMSSRLDEADNKVLEIADKLIRSNTTDQELRKGWIFNQRMAEMSYLNHWEFFSFLVNTGEIHEEKILGYYKDILKEKVELVFDGYPDVKYNKDYYKEIKKLLKEWDPSYDTTHNEPR